MISLAGLSGQDLWARSSGKELRFKGLGQDKTSSDDEVHYSYDSSASIGDERDADNFLAFRHNGDGANRPDRTSVKVPNVVHSGS